MIRRPRRSTLFPYTTLSRSDEVGPRLPRDLDVLRGRDIVGFGLGDLEELHAGDLVHRQHGGRKPRGSPEEIATGQPSLGGTGVDRKSTRLNSSHDQISYAVF